MSNPTVDWERVGDRFYRKTKLYDDVFDVDLELENYIIAGAPYAGALGRRRSLPSYRLVLTGEFKALYRDETKLQTFRNTKSAKSGIDIYSCAGSLIRRINVRFCAWSYALLLTL